ncbi:MAG: hypothetical protein C0467_11210 [Planctomycetaceae bacterium]|nr:hypothetical protein [Planctomycetaceae bacterium]
MLVRILLLAVFVGFSGVASADDKKADKPKSDPPGLPLELKITGKTTKYTLDLGGLSADDFKKAVAAAGKGKGRAPAPPVVDLTIELKNTSKDTVQVWSKGDPVVLTLELKGKGAMSAMPLVPMTLEFRLPDGVGVEAGKTLNFPLKSLAAGFRGASQLSYWTEPGEYELVATLKTGLMPIPKGAMDNGDGYGIITLTTPPIKLTVEEKK